MKLPFSKDRTVCRHALISGRVQGVWYRGATAEQAKHLGIRGWVRNLSSGDVEAMFEGASDAVQEMLRWCETGPPSARVDEVQVRDAPARDREGFRIRQSR